MANVEGVAKAIGEWLDHVDPCATMVVAMETHQVAALHYYLEVLQDLLEKSPPVDDSLELLGLIRKRVEEALSQAGYGGNPRP